MSNSLQTRVLLINGESTQQGDVSRHLRGSSQFLLTTATPDQAPEHLRATSTDLVIVDLENLEEEEVQILTSVRGQDASVPLIVVSPELSPEAMRQLFKFHVQDWLKKPLDPEKLLSAVRASVRDKKVRNNRVHAIVSAVGGAGATTAAITMADIAANTLFRKNKASISLFDLDFSTGNCSYLLNQINPFNLASVANTPQRVDAEFIRAIQQKHERDFFIYSFKQPELNTDLNGYELVLRLLDAVNQEHDHTFVDLPYYETEWRDDVLSAVNTCTLVTELNLPAIKHTLDQVRRIKTLRGDTLPIRVLINKRVRHLFGQRIGRRKLKELFEDVELFYVPLEADLIGEAVDRGLTLSQVSKRNRYTKALTKYMKSIELTEEGVA